MGEGGREGGVERKARREGEFRLGREGERESSSRRGREGWREKELEESSARLEEELKYGQYVLVISLNVPVSVQQAAWWVSCLRGRE
jgi:hypothetical protein